jgi:hypothetical protein
MPGLHLILFHSLLPNKEVLPNTCSVLILLVQTMLRISADMLIYVPIYRNWQVTYKIKPYRLCLSFGPIIGLANDLLAHLPINQLGPSWQNLVTGLIISVMKSFFRTLLSACCVLSLTHGVFNVLVV